MPAPAVELVELTLDGPDELSLDKPAPGAASCLLTLSRLRLFQSLSTSGPTVAVRT